MIDWLQNEFYALMKPFINNEEHITLLYSEIIEAYQNKKRFYHNEQHIYSMLVHLNDISDNIVDLNSVKIAIWYHDIIYNPIKNSNEEKSAELAKKRLKSIDFDQKRIEVIQKLIISTKNHELILTNNDDNAYLLDLDLSILGSNWEVYQKYIRNIRKEYKIYPDFMYNPGRKKVLLHFLDRETLYFTKNFRDKFENQARNNIKKELDLLN